MQHYQCYRAIDHAEQPHGTQIDNCYVHYSVLSSLEDECLDHCQNGDQQSMVSKKQVIKIHLTSFLLTSRVEVAVGAINGVEGEACEIHGQEVKIHSFDTA